MSALDVRKPFGHDVQERCVEADCDAYQGPITATQPQDRGGVGGGGERRTDDGDDDPSLAGIVRVPELLTPAGGPASDKEAILGALPRDSSLQLSSRRILDPVWRSHTSVSCGCSVCVGRGGGGDSVGG